MKKGDILLIRCRLCPIGYSIRRITKSDYNHVALAINKTHLIESVGRGIIISPLSKYVNKKRYLIKLVRIIGLKPEPMNKVIKFALKKQCRYGYWNWAYSFILLLFKYKGKLPRITCSGLIALSLSKAKWHFRKNKALSRISPGDISQTTKLRLKNVSYELNGGTYYVI